MNQQKISKFLSLVLRHRPDKIGMQLEPEGWLPIAELVTHANRLGIPLTSELLLEIVATNDKQRFALSDDGLRIRANQGHSVSDVELGLDPIAPPDALFHGTVARFVESIRQHGLRKGSRNHVHLSADFDTATKVGSRRGKPIVLTVNAHAMHLAGHVFYMSANGVWLTEHVPAQYLRFP
ncbi:MAG TPA: RNA 2'-phosphotransferase [Pirellulaceae bacterium]|nr:RNA 2'-phosphotransferase [Pirellulaceae bacterium]HMO90716.1 RNA 2'-phosphotransferase [Pirellulaceae bacterium]HMP71078.1 RNA 2'-phosphotransferase [Pirellulaceae bacterium]